jgi:hypothetical protein
VSIACENAFGAGVAGDSGNDLVVSCHYARVADFHLTDSLPDADYEGDSGDEAKRFSVESNRSEPRRNHHERAHSSPEIARLDAKVTPVNINVFGGRSNRKS